MNVAGVQTALCYLVLLNFYSSHPHFIHVDLYCKYRDVPNISLRYQSSMSVKDLASVSKFFDPVVSELPHCVTSLRSKWEVSASITSHLVVVTVLGT